MSEFIDALKRKVLDGGMISADEAMALARLEGEEREALWNAAGEVTRKLCDDRFDSCSIINARSGHCPEDCHWCAQSARYNTGATVYPLVDSKTCLDMAELNKHHGIGRFSLVTSGRAMRGEELDRVCGYYEEMTRRGGLYLCASMGLMKREDLEKLAKAGCRRYHCNLETAPSHFGKLCTTHTVEDKMRTLRDARAAGMDVCSGGIIGMGETMEQRVEFALALREVEPVSIPVNVLIPIPGTPLENAAPLSDEEILTTVAIFRMVHPRVTLRFAGGRASMSRELQLRALHTGINGAIMGDMLTTLGSGVAEDRELVKEAGLKFE